MKQAKDPKMKLIRVFWENFQEMEIIIFKFFIKLIYKVRIRG